MSRKATCLGNAAIESFFHIMKVEVMDEQFETKAALIKAMTEWIDFYNHRRIKTKLDGKSPAKYRELTVQKVA
ncbi:IS3 family transposase [Lactiplantibacillus plantarum]|nr:IS3 family transposase [Lactiplantibacillus plantarum]